MLRKIGLLIVVSLLFLNALGEPGEKSEYRIVNAGIAHDKTSLCAMRDRYGFLWVGTLNGLVCYDGNGKSVYTSNSGVLPQTEGISVSSFFEKDDDIWFGGTQGLYIFHRDENRMERFPYKTRYNVQISSSVQRIVEGDDGRIWIITHGQGLFIFNPADGSLIQDSVNGASYSDLRKGGDGKLYAATQDGYLLVFNADGSLCRRMRLPDFVTDKNPISMAVIGDVLRIASNKRIYAYRMGESDVRIELQDAGFGVINAMTEGKNDFWLGTNEGIFRYPGGNSPDNTSLADSRVVKLIPDGDDGFIVVSRTGIGFLSEGQTGISRVMERGKGDFDDTVNVICRSADRRTIWIGTDHGISRYDEASGMVEPLSLPFGMDIVVTSIAEQGSQLWIGSSHQGLFRYDVTTGEMHHYRYDENIPYAVISNSINKVYVTHLGEVFILTNWGLCRYNKSQDNFEVVTEIGNGIPLVEMAEDGNGRLWGASSNNLIYVRDKSDSRFSLIESKAIGKNGISLMHCDADGRLLVVAGGNRIFYYDEESGDFRLMGSLILGASSIAFIEEGAAGELWIGTDKSVIRFDPVSKVTDYSYLTDKDVLLMRGAACRLDNGSILFGAYKALCELNPGVIASEDLTERAYILGLSFPYLEESGDELKRLDLDRLLYTLDEITLPYSDNTFTIHFAGARKSGSPEVRYLYMLEGVDKTWIPASGSEVTYADLSPGTYTFSLRPDSGPESAMDHLTIHIPAPWYLSWVAFVVYAILALMAVLSIMMISRRRLQRQSEERIREMRTQKERETYESKMRFFVNLVHEIRTPLTLISLPLEKLSESVDGTPLPDKEKRKSIASMQRNLDYLLGIINQLLDFRKAEHDSEVRLSVRDTDIVKSVSEICHRFRQPMLSQGKELEIVMPEERIVARVDRGKFDRVVMNLVGNAMKYSRHKVSVKLSAGDDGTLVLTISDDGIGINDNERDKIFDTYYQISGDDVGATLGTGLGLTYARLVTRAHGGDISVGNLATGGAVFRLTLPVSDSTDEVEDETLPSPEECTPEEEQSLPDEKGGEDKKKTVILLVEDNDELRNDVAHALKSYYDVVSVPDGETALKELESNDSIDIIVSDYMMPGIDGAELCRRVKDDINMSYIPFIMLTAKSGREAKEESMRVGADAFVEKPFTIKQLRLQISNILNTRELFYKKMRGSEVMSDSVADEPLINRMDADFLAVLNKHILDNILDEDISIDAIAGKMDMSRSTFYRRIKAVTGMSPVDYLKNYRLEHAARLLKDGMRVSEVALMVGFTSSSYFAKCFRAKFGMIPKEYVSAHTT